MKVFETTPASRRTGLVIVFPIGVTGLFNPVVHGLVREVEEKLEGVHVTYALSSGAAPTVPDALAATRFAGCDSAIVLHTDESDSMATDADGPVGDWRVKSTVDGLTAKAVVHAFETARSSLDHAA